MQQLGTESKPYIQGRASGRYETLENESQIWLLRTRHDDLSCSQMQSTYQRIN